MNDWLKGVSACPACKSSLDWESMRAGDSRLEDLFLVVCTECDSEYPLWLERPILIGKHRLKRVVFPIYEAVHRRERHNRYESIAWLSTMIRDRGLEECLSWIRQDWEDDQESGDWYTMLKEVEADVKTRKSGRWFNENSQRRRLLEAPTAPMPSTADQRPLSHEFVPMTLQAHPRRLLDVASGGGFNLSRTLGVGADVEFAVGTERDLKCLWSVEYRLAYIGKRDISEIVGADVRQLPFADEVFDYATAWQALGEICGIERMLREVFRVLTPGGRFQVSYKSSRSELSKEHRIVLKALDTPLPNEIQNVSVLSA